MYSKEKHGEIVKKSHERSINYGVEKERVFPKKILKGNEVLTNIQKNNMLMENATQHINVAL